MSMDKFEQEYWKTLTGGSLPHLAKFENVSLYEKLVNEDKHREVNIGQKALGYLKSNLKEDVPVLIDNEKLKDRILDFWPYYNDFCIMCMQNKLWMLEIDFSDMAKAEKILRRIDPEFNVKLNDDKDGKIGGLTVKLADRQYVILINRSLHKNENMILHEFTHYVQFVSGKLVSDEAVRMSKEVKDFFRIDDQFIDYALNRYEFYANVYNDIFNGFQKIYWTYFNKSYSWKDYIEGQMNELKKNVYEYRDSFLTKIWKHDTGSILPYLDVLACISYVDEKFFDEIADKLKNE